MLNDYAEMLEFAIGAGDDLDADTRKRQQDALEFARLIETEKSAKPVL